MESVKTYEEIFRTNYPPKSVLFQQLSARNPFAIKQEIGLYLSYISSVLSQMTDFLQEDWFFCQITGVNQQLTGIKTYLDAWMPLFKHDDFYSAPETLKAYYTWLQQSLIQINNLLPSHATVCQYTPVKQTIDYLTGSLAGRIQALM